jgi:Na+/H+ antiporter NhaD/arsenite permease-like protein
MFTKVKDFFKKETVCCIAFLLAVISMCFVVPSKNYISYIDFRVLALLFCLMAVVRGFSSIGVFTRLGTMLLTHVHSLRMLSALFIFLCFFFSMLITNDVALITFVPFTILVLSMAEQKKFLIPVIVLETIAANLGSMLTPLGNPQNLYLYTISGLSIGAFVRIMLPYSFVSAILLLIFILFLPKDTVSTATAANTANSTNTVTASNTSNVICEAVKTRKNSRILFAFYLILFLLCLLTVLHILPYQILFFLVLTGFLLLDYRVLKDVDYFLLLTFLCFFIFIGNMKQISLVHELISKLLVHHEVLMGIGASQIISNVPAAILLSGFTDDYSALLIGVNLGGLGTLIASLASLISFKFYTNSNGNNTRRFLGIFTLYNVIFLGVLFVLSLILC